MLKYHIQTIEVGATSSAGITFTNIPQIYDDLLVVVSARSVSTGDIGGFIKLNGVQSTQRTLYGTGSSVTSEPGNLTSMVNTSSWTANTFSSAQAYIANYRSSVSKSISFDAVTENNSTTGFQAISAATVATSSPVTSLQVYSADTSANGNWVQYSSASLYGIKRGSSGQVEVASGGTITTSGGYTIHTFTSSGTFVANRDLDVEYLVVGGGGAGGADRAGGGGAGGYRSSVQGELSGGGLTAEPKLSVSSGQSFIVQVGAGGIGTSTTKGGNGTSSQFANIISQGGGGGGANLTGLRSGLSGGSGGGTYLEAPGSGTTGQGFAGGNGNSNVGGGGGGGGELGDTDAAGHGGDGVSSSINGTPTFRAGGGGGGFPFGSPGIGGDGGGANGASEFEKNNATPNTGGGGGGGGRGGGEGGNGGSGIVIIRYLTPAS